MKVDARTLAQFVSGSLPADGFDHRAHVAVGCALLGKHDFVAALTQFARGARAVAASAGAPDAFNLTMTVAWLSLLAERLHESRCDSVDALLEAHPELGDGAMLRRLYSSQRIGSRLARDTFLLPDRAP